MKKYLTGILMAVFAFIVILPLQARADEREALYLEAEGEGVKVRLTLPGADGAMLSSLMLSLEVTSDTAEKLDASFQFDASLSGKALVQEARYQAETGTLNVYVAGRDPLFAKGEKTITLGKVIAEDGAFMVGAREDSLTVAEGASKRTVNLDSLPEPVLAGATFSGTVTPPGSEPSSGAVTPPGTENPSGIVTTPETETSSGTVTVPGSETPSGAATSPENVAIPEKSGEEGGFVSQPPVGDESLQQAVNMAKEYAKENYTDKSYNTLEKAVKNAESILNNSNAAQEEKEEALQSLQNAVGALEDQTLTSAEKKNNQNQSSKEEDVFKEHTPVILYAMIALLVLVIVGITVYGIKYKKSSGNYL